MKSSLGFTITVGLLAIFDICFCQSEHDELVFQVKDDIYLECGTTATNGETCFWSKIQADGGADIVAVSGGVIPPRHQLIDKASEGNCSLLISDVNIEDNGVFTCVIAPNVYRKVIRVTIGVAPKDPVILYNKLEVPNGYEILLDLASELPDKIDLECHVAKGKPQPQVIWTLGDKTVDATHNEVEVNGPYRIYTLKSHMLLPVNQLLPNDQMTVTCKAFHIYYPENPKITSVVLKTV